MKPSIILVFLLISIPDFAQDWLEDKEDLKGKVKSVHYSAVSRDKSFATYYNHKGFLVRLTTGSDPEFVEHEVYRIYDETQTRCLIEYDQFSSDIDTSKKGMFVYTQDGKVREEKYPIRTYRIGAF